MWSVRAINSFIFFEVKLKSILICPKCAFDNRGGNVATLACRYVKSSSYGRYRISNRSRKWIYPQFITKYEELSHQANG